MNNIYTLQEYMPFWRERGFFGYMMNPPWGALTTLQNRQLDLFYFANHSGKKYISPYLEELTQNTPLTIIQTSECAANMLSYFVKYWEKYWQLLVAEYNPIENYSMEENLIDEIIETEYGKQHVTDNDFSNTRTGSEQNIITDTKGNTNKLKGFNSLILTETSGNTETNNSTETRTYNNVKDQNDGTITENDSGTDTQTKNYKLTRTGNIGTVTVPDMLKQEFEIWQWKFFENVVFKDLDSILTLNIY